MFGLDFRAEGILIFLLMWNCKNRVKIMMFARIAWKFIETETADETNYARILGIIGGRAIILMSIVVFKNTSQDKNALENVECGIFETAICSNRRIDLAHYYAAEKWALFFSKGHTNSSILRRRHHIVVQCLISMHYMQLLEWNVLIRMVQMRLRVFKNVWNSYIYCSSVFSI